MEVEIYNIDRVIELTDEIASPAFGIPSNVVSLLESGTITNFWESNSDDYQQVLLEARKIQDVIESYEISVKNIARSLGSYARELRDISNRRVD